MSDRHFCTRCGGRILTRHPSLGWTDEAAAIVRGLVFSPSVHLSYAQSVLPMPDGLPKLSDFPAEVGGSGERLPCERTLEADRGHRRRRP